MFCNYSDDENLNDIKDILTRIHKQPNEVDDNKVIPYIYKKFMNIFMYYIFTYNTFKNYFFIKSIENIITSDKYRGVENVKTEINEEILKKQKIYQI